MKTPDETKKGLECCLGDCHNYHCEECPYRNPDTVDYDGCPDNGRKLAEDALALIQQLEEDKARLGCTVTQLSGTIKHLRDVESRIPRWISVEERLPEGNPPYCQTVIVCTIDGKVLPGFCNHGKWYVMQEEDDFCNDADEGEVTHWMPLPLPPSSAEADATSLGDGGFVRKAAGAASNDFPPKEGTP